MSDARSDKVSSGDSGDTDSRIAAQLSTQRNLVRAAIGVLLLGIFYTLYFAAEFLLSITLALLFYLVLAPVSQWLENFRIPTPVSAALIVIGMISAIGFSVYSLATPIETWLSELARVDRQTEYKFRALKRPMEAVQKASDQVEKMTDVTAEAAAAEVTIKQPTMIESFADNLPRVIYSAAISLVLLFFLLASGDLLREKVVRAMPTFRDKRTAARVMNHAQRAISRYLFTITMINAGLGTVIGLGLWLIGLPNPLLWGIIAGLLNFIPYFGFILGTAIVAIVGLVSFDTLGQALMAPAIYAAANFIEAQVITPSLLGRRFTMNPVAVFISIAFWSWIWGVVGAILAVPILVTVKTICDHVDTLGPLGEFLGGRRTPRNDKAAKFSARPVDS